MRSKLLIINIVFLAITVFSILSLLLVFNYISSIDERFVIYLILGLPILALFSFFVTLILFISRSFMENSFRSADMEKLGKAIGWDFQKKANLVVLKSDAQQLKLGEYIDYHPLHGETRNLLTGKIYDIDGYIEYGSISDDVRKNFEGKIKSYDAMVFDQKIYHDVLEHGYKLESFTKGSVGKMESKNQTIFLMKLKGVNFPPFCIEPEGFWGKMRGLVEKHDFDFPDFPVFSHKYQLYGDLRDLDLKKIFNENVLRFYEKQNPSFVTIGNEDRLLVYTPDQLLDPKDFDKEMKFSIKLAKCFLQTEK